MNGGVRRVGRATLLGAGTTVATLAAEAWFAVHHDYLPTSPVMEISGTLGPEDAEPLTLAVLGDSSVAGVGADAPEETLTYGVAKALADSYRVRLHALGVSGARVSSVIATQLPQLAEVDPDVVLVCVGTNDLTHCTPTPTLRRQLRLLAGELSRVAPHAVVVASGMPAADTSRAFAQPLRAVLGARALWFTHVFEQELVPRGITVFDVGRTTRHAFASQPELFSRDRFHPSSAGYAYLSIVYGKAVRAALLAARGIEEPPDSLEMAG